ncbi:pentatricopeptide repeat-containing protein At1g08070, chloroplastic-like [Bidens hawaiensis]|uniref:pentatricopeptide repeat-containing protein At1g08070, chloroplastic-like n=1 Tax=Bidens hawaiensis TaxID=980011 RepID=UPI00404A4871
MTLDYDLVPEINQYACLIDLYARRVITEMSFDANAVMWSSILSCCKEYGNVELGREAAYKLFELELHSPVPYLILADIYASVDLWNEVQNVRMLINENGVRKSLAGWSKLGYVGG